MKSLIIVLKEQFHNRYMMNRLALYELKSMYAGNTLGMLWAILNPLTQIMVYWLVFGLGIRNGAVVNGVPFFLWLICGIVPWFYISAGLLRGSNSIHAKLGMVSKMNFPLSVVPSYVLLSQLYTHLILIGLTFIFIFFYHGISNINIFGLLYFIFTTSCFLFAISFVTSTLATILRDIQLVIQSIVRLLFYLTPVLWVPFNLPFWFEMVLKLNPFYYVIGGYRAALLWNDMRIIWSWYSIYFWSLTLVLLLIGTMLHVKFRRQFVDYL
jgi:teichoic acid transport system permease protein